MELYTEKLVKKLIDNKDLTVKSLIVALTGVIIYVAFSLLGIGYGQWALTFFISASAVYGAYYLFKRGSVEYEYSYCNGEFDIDVIYGQTKRKDLVSFDVADCEIFAKYDQNNDPSLKNRSIVKKFYAVSHKGAKSAYYVIFNNNGVKTMAVFEVDDNVLENVKLRARRIFKEV